MSGSRRERLDVYLAKLRLPASERQPKRRAINWPLYAALTGSAMALSTNSSLTGAEPVPGRLMANQFVDDDHPQMRSVVALMAARNSGRSMVSSPVAANPQSSAPAIAAGGIVPLYGSASIIQPGSWISITGTNLAAGTADWNGIFPPPWAAPA